jgi:hypothetical protein
MSKHKESRVGYVVLCGLAIYVVMSLAIALKGNDSACGGTNGNRHWNYAPPGWICD